MSSSIVVAVRALSGDGDGDGDGEGAGQLQARQPQARQPQASVAVPRSGGDDPAAPTEPSGYAHFQLSTFLLWQELLFHSLATCCTPIQLTSCHFVIGPGLMQSSTSSSLPSHSSLGSRY
jgi:hypothetical protein